jgi:hypothetical protein
MKIIFYKFFWGTLLIPQIIYLMIKNVPKIIIGDSFFAESLRLFYLRLYKISTGKDLYVRAIGRITTEGFVYQSFAAIKICYQVLNRRLYVLISHICFLIYLFNIFSTKEALILSCVFLFSSVFYFNQLERGNYSYMGLVFSLIASHYYFTSGLNMEFLFLYIVSIFFSISSFVILSLVIGINLLITSSWHEFFSIFSCGFLILVLFILSNIFFLKLKNKNFKLKILYVGIDNILITIGLLKYSKKNKNTSYKLQRRTSYFKGFVSILPFLFAVVIDKDFLSHTFFVLVIIIFLNQSKILRFFDYYFIYTWSFCYFLLSFQGSSWTEILALIIIGTNPIYIYAIDNYNFTSVRGFKIAAPIFLTKNDRNKILKKLSSFLSGRNLIVMPINKKIKEYNDLWRMESLLLEWIWTAADNSKIRFYPDWFSIFLAYNTKVGLHSLEKLAKIPNTKKITFEKLYREKLHKKTMAHKLSKIFNKEILIRYTTKIKNYFLILQ